jgi:adenylosuccinate lyase
VLLALIDKGMSREDAYRVVQTSASAAWDEGRDFREELRGSPEIRKLLDGSEFEALFDPTAHLQHLDQVFDRLEKLEVRSE